MARSASLGDESQVELSQGRVTYRERGQGPPVVFIHGLLVNADLWHAVVPEVAQAGFRCVAPDLPLGAHSVPAKPGADLSPPGMAALVEEFLAALDLTDVTLVANDTGGAVVQILMARGSERVARVVLTSCDSLERFFPPVFRFLQWLGWVPGGTWLVANVSSIQALQRLPLVFGWLAKRPIPHELRASFGEPARRSRAVRRDLQRFLRSAHRRHTLSAAERFPDFDRPVLLAWAREDKLFPLTLAERLRELLPNARLEIVDDAYTFIPLDQPEELARLITRFAGSMKPTR